jgi:hypothetical protein
MRQDISATPFVEGGTRQPHLKLYNATTLASIATRRIPQLSDI